MINKILFSPIKLKYIFFISLSLHFLYSCNAGNASNFKPKDDKKMENQKQEIAIFGAGCFWCVEAVFEDLKGVLKVESGYTGGKIKNPTYKEVCSGLTGHAEVARITFNPDIISFETLLSVFFKTHDPTTLNFQGNDRGTQYRSSIFYTSDNQKESSERIISELNAEKVYPNPIVTEVSKFEVFYIAEDYHQNYYKQNMNESYCQYVIQPKVDKFKKVFKQYLK
jgi:peptide-methionine (S)-S-oxide reductase